MLTTTGLRFRHPGQAPLHFPDLSVGAGEELLLLGPSGAGKTTLLHLLAGLLRPSEGHVIVAGQDLAELSASALDRWRGAHVGIVFQKPYFLAALTVGENLRLSPKPVTAQRRGEVAHRLGIARHLRRDPATLSAGEQQRLNIARAVLRRPRLLLADEPTSALDDDNVRHVVDLLRDEARAADAALVIVTHDGRLRAWIPRQVRLQQVRLP